VCCAPSPRSGRKDIEVVASTISGGQDQCPSAALRFGPWPLPGIVTVDGDSIASATADQGFRQARSVKLPWKELPGVDIALRHQHPGKAKASAHHHRRRQARAGIAPSDNADATIVLAVTDKLTKRSPVGLNGFTTTNCLTRPSQSAERQTKPAS
jgi:hypothetical protein